MRGLGWERWGAVSGIIFVVLIVVGFTLLPQGPGSEGTAQEFTDFFTDNRNPNPTSVGTALVALAGFFFLWFVGALWARLRQAEGAPGWGSGVAFAGGVAYVVLFFMATSANVAMSNSLSRYDNFQVDPNSGMLLRGMSYWLLGHAGVAAGVLISATSAVAIKTRVLPLWLAWPGFAVAVLSVLAIFLWWFIWLVWLWVLLTSVLMLIRRTDAAQPST